MTVAAAVGGVVSVLVGLALVLAVLIDPVVAAGAVLIVGGGLAAAYGLFADRPERRRR